MEFIPLIAALALAVKIVDFVKYISNRDTNGIITQLAVWVSGVVVVFLLAATDFADGVEVAGMTLDSLNVWSQVLLGLTLGSTGSFAYDFKKSLDNTDSAVMPTLKKK